MRETQPVTRNALPADRLKSACSRVPVALGCWLLAWIVGPLLQAQPARVFIAVEGSNSVVAIDPIDNTVLATIPVAGTPGLIGATPDGSRLFVPGRASNQVTVINTSTNGTTPLNHATLSEPVAVAFVPSRTEAWVLNRTGGPGNNGSISVFNSATLAFVEEITSVSFSLPEHLAVDLGGSRAFVVNGGNATLTTLFTNSRNVLFNVGVGTTPRFVVAGPTFVYVANSGSGNVSRVNLAARTATSMPIGGQPRGMALDIAGNRLLVALQNDRVGIFNLQTQEPSQVVVGDATFSSHSIALLQGTTLAYVSDANGNRVAALNLANLTMVGGNGLPLSGLNGPRAITTTGTVSTSNLSLTLADSPDPVSGGQQLTYSINVHNGGPSSSTGTQVTLQPSGQFQFVSATLSQGSCQLSGQLVLCDLGTLVFDQAVAISIRINPLAAGSFSAMATVAADQNDPVPGNNSATVTTTVTPAADLAVTLTDSPDPVTVGGLLTYRATVTNNGPLLSEGVRFFDPLPQGVQLGSVTGGLANCTGGATSVICNLESLLPGSSAEILIQVIPTRAGNLLNGVDVRAQTADPVEGNNAAIVQTTVIAGGTDLVLTKTSTSPLVYQGGVGMFRFRVANQGPNAAAGVDIVDVLPEGLEFLSLIPAPGAQCGVTDGPLRCRIASLASGATIDLMIRLQVSAPPGAVLSNTASVSAVGPDPQPANNQSTTTVRVTEKGDVNGDGVLDAADVQSLILELNDGDGTDVAQVAAGSFAGNASMDLNGDGQITPADLSVLVDLISGT